METTESAANKGFVTGRATSQATLEEASKAELRFRVGDALPQPPENQPLPLTDASLLSKGGNCGVCLEYLPPGTAIAGLVWCRRHRSWRHRACLLPASTDSQPPSQRRRDHPLLPCTCTGPLASRTRVVVLSDTGKFDKTSAGTHVEVDLSVEGGGEDVPASMRVAMWYPKRQVGPEVLTALATRLGARLE